MTIANLYLKTLILSYIIRNDIITPHTLNTANTNLNDSIGKSG